MGFLRMGLLWASAPGPGPESAPASGRALAEGAPGKRGTPVVGARVPSPRSPEPAEREQFREPPLVGACTLPAAEVPRRPARTCAPAAVPVSRRGSLLLRAALSGQASRPTPHRLWGHVSTKTKALSLPEGCPPRPHGHNTLALCASCVRISESEGSCTLRSAERSSQHKGSPHRSPSPETSAEQTNFDLLLLHPGITDLGFSLSPLPSPLSHLLPSLPLLFLSLYHGMTVGQFPLPYWTREYPLPFPSCRDSHLFSPFH